MNKVFTVIAFILLSSPFLYTWENSNIFVPYVTANPYNDKEIVFIGDFTNSEYKDYYINTLDLTTGKSNSVKIITNYSDILAGAFISDRSKSIGYFNDDKIIVYNYITMQKISEISTPYDLSETQLRTGFSKNGELIYLFNKSEFKILIYNVASGLKVKEFIINSNPTLYFDVFLNSDKDEFVLGINDSLEFRSIETEAILRKIPFNSKAKMIQFRSNGGKISYKLNSNDIFVVNSLNGQEEYHKTSAKVVEYYEFSAQMNYLTISDLLFDNVVYDVQADTLINYNDIIGDEFPNVIFYYINSNNSKALGTEKITIFCNKDLEMPATAYIYYLYDLKKTYNKISIPETFIAHAGNIVINRQNNLIVVFDKGNESTGIKKSILLSGNGEFIKNIYSEGIPLAFTYNSDYIAFADSNKIYFYNFQTETVDKVLTTNINVSFLDFINSDKQRIVTSDYSFIDIYDYSDFSLISSYDLKSLGINMKKIYCNEDGSIRYCTENEVYIIDYPKSDTKQYLTKVPANSDFYDATRDMNFFLYRIGIDSLIVYDVQNQTIKYSYKIKNLLGNFGISNFGFLGSENLIYMSYINNPIDKYEEYHAYDFINQKIIEISGDPIPIISKDGLHYAYKICPTIYGFDGIPNPVSVEEYKINSAELKINPNPSTDYIEINFNNHKEISLNTNYQIYDLLGTDMTGLCISDSGNNNDVLRINISKLSSGVYFIKIGERLDKFVKI